MLLVNTFPDRHLPPFRLIERAEHLLETLFHLQVAQAPEPVDTKLRDDIAQMQRQMAAPSVHLLDKTVRLRSLQRVVRPHHLLQPDLVAAIQSVCTRPEGKRPLRVMTFSLLEPRRPLSPLHPGHWGTSLN